MTSLTSLVKEEAKRLGARIVGIGTSDRWVNAPQGHRPENFVPNARSDTIPFFGFVLLRRHDEHETLSDNL